MKFQYISAPVSKESEDGTRYLFPPSLTRYFYRFNFLTEAKGEIVLSLGYPFALEVYLNGESVSERRSGDRREFDLTGLCRPGENRIGIRTRLSNDRTRFLPVLSGELRENGKLLSRADASWESFTFPAFYTDREEENWQTRDFGLHWAVEYDVDPRKTLRSHCFRKSFEVGETLRSARGFAAAKGMYELWINGRSAMGKRVLAPGMVSAPGLGLPYRPASADCYQEFDLLPFLRAGRNAVGLLSGNGWYASEGFNTIRVQPNEVAFVLELEYESGKRETVSTDASWLTHPSPLVENDLQWGVRWDARLEIPGWSEPEGSEAGFLNAVETDTEPEVLLAQPFADLEETMRLAPAGESKSDEGIVFDFGENLSGRAAIRLERTDAGQKIVLRYGERQNADGNLSGGPYYDVLFAWDTHRDGPANWGAKNLDCIISAGGALVFEPPFAFTGFRYVEVIGADRGQIAEISARKMRTAEPETFSFRTDNSVLNEIFDASKRSYLANLFCGPIDCPTREKNYWNGDACIIVPTALYFAEGETLFRHWTKYGRKIDSDAAGWRDEIYTVPLELWKFYGSDLSVRENYAKIRELAEERISVSEDGFWNGDGVTFFGDHAQPKGMRGTDRAIYSQCFFYRNVEAAAQCAERIGETADALRFRKLLPAISDAFGKRCFPDILNRGVADAGKRSSASEDFGDSDRNLGDFVLPLAFGLVVGETAERFAAELNRRLIGANFTVNCGTVSAAHLLPVLTRFGYFDTAFRTATCTKYPSWGHMISVTGATTTTEYWEGNDSSEEAGDSLNHCFKGAIVRWMAEDLAGIHPTSPGFASLELAPRFPEGLNRLKAEFLSRAGKIGIDWHRENGTLTLDVEVPVDSVLALNGNRIPLAPGLHRFVC